MKKRIISIVLAIATLFAMSSIAFSASAATVSKPVAVSNAVVSKPVADSNAIVSRPTPNTKYVMSHRTVYASALALRTAPRTGNVKLYIPYGQTVYVYYTTNGWAYCYYKSGYAHYWGWVCAYYLG